MHPQDSTAVPSVRRTASPGMLEALVGLAILVALSGVVMPILGAESTTARAEQAWGDMASLADGLSAYTRDTLYLPTGTQGRTNLGLLTGPGLLPDGLDFQGEIGDLSAALMADAEGGNVMGGEGWAGPYLPSGELGPDPWGNAYLVHTEGWFNGRHNAFILSAGADGIAQTTFRDTRAQGDDLIWHLD